VQLRPAPERGGSVGSRRPTPAAAAEIRSGSSGWCQRDGSAPCASPAISGTRTLPDSYLNCCLSETGKGTGPANPANIRRSATPARPGLPCGERAAATCSPAVAEIAGKGIALPADKSGNRMGTGKQHSSSESGAGAGSSRRPIQLSPRHSEKIPWQLWKAGIGWNGGPALLGRQRAQSLQDRRDVLACVHGLWLNKLIGTYRETKPSKRGRRRGTISRREAHKIPWNEKAWARARGRPTKRRYTRQASKGPQGCSDALREGEAWFSSPRLLPRCPRPQGRGEHPAAAGPWAVPTPPHQRWFCLALGGERRKTYSSRREGMCVWREFIIPANTSC